jgi:hypothetical protein
MIMIIIIMHDCDNWRASCIIITTADDVSSARRRRAMA